MNIKIISIVENYLENIASGNYKTAEINMIQFETIVYFIDAEFKADAKIRAYKKQLSEICFLKRIYNALNSIDDRKLI